MLRKLKKTAQSTAEYAIIIAIVVGAVIAMQVYVKRGLQARIHDAVTGTATAPPGGLNGEENPFTGAQYEPEYSASQMDVNRGANTQQEMGRGANRQVTTAETSTRTGTQTTVGTAAPGAGGGAGGGGGGAAPGGGSTNVY